MTKKILVTGGAGFVGRRLVKFMLDKGLINETSYLELLDKLNKVP